ncbi:Angiopoietin-1 receptor like protein [Argiope bruennichi]|uniref:Angiopoietin-1 receptor like protein n=1 Tax=Argiope bruennichi TaxID=94029 RepID=A0A8T0FUL7_ARGBR|nr:Angiopoietin-1 receptor like protein [Argiope bruennichi]
MEIYNICRLILILVLFRASDAEVSLKEVNCSSAVSDCPPDITCRVNCNDDCIKNEEDVFGTVFYPEFSPICKSAIHDFRISMWNSSERTVTFQRDQPKNVFFGSKRMHISSNLKDVHEAGDAISSYKFLSPYISENLLDVASLHTDYLFGEKGLHNQFCFVSKKSTNLKFDQYCNTNIEKPCVLLATRALWVITSEWKLKKNDEKLNAGYQCFPENKTLSTLTSLAFRKDAYFYPTTLTKTVSVHEEVTLQMTENGVCGDKATVWRKDRGHAITQDVSRTSIFFPKVEVGHAGIYSLECSNSDVSRAGFVHLIVRACPNGKHGNLCSKDCPECLNGGICHDLNGECVCPPGFYGPMCEKAAFASDSNLKRFEQILNGLWAVGNCMLVWLLLFEGLSTFFLNSSIGALIVELDERSGCSFRWEKNEIFVEQKNYIPARGMKSFCNNQGFPMAFKSLVKDPRCRDIPKNVRKVKVDKRFQKLLRHKQFKGNNRIDERGRVVNFSNSEKLKKLYNLKDSNEEESSENSENEQEDTKGKKASPLKIKKDGKSKKDKPFDVLETEGKNLQGKKSKHLKEEKTITPKLIRDLPENAVSSDNITDSSEEEDGSVNSEDESKNLNNNSVTAEKNKNLSQKHKVKIENLKSKKSDDLSDGKLSSMYYL